MRPTLDDIFAEEDEFGLLDVKASTVVGATPERANEAILREVEAFYERQGRLPDPDAAAHDEMRLGVIFGTVSRAPSASLQAMDRFGLLGRGREKVREQSWRDEPLEEDLPIAWTTSSTTRPSKRRQRCSSSSM